MKIGDVVSLREDVPKFIKDSCPKFMVLKKQGNNKEFFSCYELDGVGWCGSIHIDYLKERNEVTEK